MRPAGRFLRRTLLLAFLLLIAIPAVRDELRWSWARYSDEAESYARYLGDWPDGRHATDAARRYDEAGWRLAFSSNSIDAYEAYLRDHPSGAHVSDAKAAVEAAAWDEARSLDTVSSYTAFLTSHPFSKHVGEAQQRVEQFDERSPRPPDALTTTPTSLGKTDLMAAAVEIMRKAAAEGRDVDHLMDAPYVKAAPSEVRAYRRTGTHCGGV
jgi:hypothetical protein